MRATAKSHWLRIWWGLALLAVAALLWAAPGALAKVDYHRNPVIFVHGFSGSGSQFESQKVRFTSNGTRTAT